MADMLLLDGAGSFSADEGDQLIRCHDGHALSAVFRKMAHVPGDEGIDPALRRYLEKRPVFRIWQAVGQGAHRDRLGSLTQEPRQYCDVLRIKRKFLATRNLFLLSESPPVRAKCKKSLTHQVEHLRRRAVHVQQGGYKDIGIKYDAHASAGRPS